MWSNNRSGDTSSDDVIASASARDEGLQASSTLAKEIFSYDWKSFDKHAEDAEKLLAPSFRKEYADTLARARANAIANQVNQKAAVSSTSVVSASDRKVVALVFLNILASGKSGKQNLLTSRLEMTLTRSGQDWRVSDIKQL